ncbi:uncharacterized protein LOC141900095 [Tubulanus polymorphus]|uniref:uncharacterized protein LOC141900095 n=1 Tax=Tubulanus polymorphus TaxID=672921 RepID=UPI003DA59FE5
MLSFMASRLYKGYQYSRSFVPIFQQKRSLKQPSSVTTHKVEKLCSILETIQQLRYEPKSALEEPASEATLFCNVFNDLQCSIVEFIKIIEKLPNDEDLSVVTDDSGYNLLQKAIIAADTDLIPVILDKGWNCDHGDCSFPLHLACKLGQLEIVELLLENGAQPDIKSSVCYPCDHSPAVCGSVPLVSYFRRTPKCLGNSDPELPISYAIENDHVDIVRLLLADPYHTGTYHYQQLFEAACRHGAFECMQFLVHHDESSTKGSIPDTDNEEGNYNSGYISNLFNYFVSHNSLDINGKNVDGLTPLHLASTQGEKYIQFLLRHSADPRIQTNSAETALHVLFRKNFAPLELLNCAKLLLGTGLERDVNELDIYGNTALHYVVSHVNHSVTSTCSTDIKCFDKYAVCTMNEDSVNADLQNKYQIEVLSCLELLLQHNLNPNIKNKAKVTAFQKMLQSLFNCIRDMYRVYGEDHNHQGVRDDENTQQNYHLDLDVIIKAMRIFLEYGIDVNGVSPAGLTPLRIVLQIILNIEPSQLSVHSHQFLKMIDILCLHGAQTNFILGNNGGTCVTLVTALAEGCLCYSSPDYTEEIKMRNANFICDLLALLLKHGMNPNYSTHRRRPYLQGGIGNALVEFVQLTHNITKPSDLLYIHQWVLTLLQNGANPDIEPYSSEPTICHSQSSIFLRHNKTQAVSHYMHQIKDISVVFNESYAEQLLNLFYNSMDHSAMYQCLNTAKARFDCLNNTNFVDLLQKMSSQPRSLKQSARVAIYKALNRNLVGNVEKLELPKTLQSYLLNIEP